MAAPMISECLVYSRHDIRCQHALLKKCFVLLAWSIGVCPGIHVRGARRTFRDNSMWRESSLLSSGIHKRETLALTGAGFGTQSVDSYCLTRDKAALNRQSPARGGRPMAEALFREAGVSEEEVAECTLGIDAGTHSFASFMWSKVGYRLEETQG